MYRRRVVTGPDSYRANSVLGRLAQQALVDGDAVYWQTGLRTFMGGSGHAGSVEVTVSVTGGEADPIVLDEGNAGVVHILAFDDVGSGENRVAFRMAGEGRLMYQVTSEHYLPWEQVPVEPAAQEPLTVEVSYDRTTLSVQDEVTAQVWVKLNAAGTAQMVLLDLGLPPRLYRPGRGPADPGGPGRNRAL